MDFDINAMASMTPEQLFDVSARLIRQANAFDGQFLAALMQDDDHPKAVAEAHARAGREKCPELIDKVGSEEALRRAAGRFGDALWGALETVSERAIGIFRSAQDLAGETPTPPPSPDAPDPRAFAERLRYLANLIERHGGYWEAAEHAADDLELEQEYGDIEGSLANHFDAQESADLGGLVVLLSCIGATLDARSGQSVP